MTTRSAGALGARSIRLRRLRRRVHAGRGRLHRAPALDRSRGTPLRLGTAGIRIAGDRAAHSSSAGARCHRRHRGDAPRGEPPHAPCGPASRLRGAPAGRARGRGHVRARARTGAALSCSCAPPPPPSSRSTARYGKHRSAGRTSGPRPTRAGFFCMRSSSASSGRFPERRTERAGRRRPARRRKIKHLLSTSPHLISITTARCNLRRRIGRHTRAICVQGAWFAARSGTSRRARILAISTADRVLGGVVISSRRRRPRCANLCHYRRRQRPRRPIEREARSSRRRKTCRTRDTCHRSRPSSRSACKTRGIRTAVSRASPRRRSTNRAASRPRRHRCPYPKMLKRFGKFCEDSNHLFNQSFDRRNNNNRCSVSLGAPATL